MDTNLLSVSGLATQLQRALEGRYTIEGEIGSGGMAVVFRAQHVELGRTVAIKVMRPDIAALLGAERFLREIRIEAQLQHPHIVALYESGSAGGIPYYVMPFVAGESLRQRLERETQLPIADALQIARQIADALSHAHASGIIHRDIKPENILMSGGQALLADFGVARAMHEAGSDRLTQSGFTLGTPAYMSPEQGGGAQNLDGRSDIYALGCVLYEMLAGQPPFTGPSQQAVLARHMHDRPPALAIVRNTIPPALEEIVTTALAKVPADRFPTAAQLSDALASVERGDPWRGRPTGRPARPWVVGAGLFGIAGAAWLAWTTTRPAARALDVNKVIGFPLAAAGLAAADSDAGYDVTLMVGAALDHAEPVRWIDGRRHLEDGVDPARLTDREARRIGRDRGARYYLDGVVRRDADSTSVILRLHDVAGDSLVAQETATGASAALPYQLGLAAVRRLLPRIIAPERVVDFSPLTDRHPAAIALWVQGEREYRQARFANALRFYQRALAEDSLLTIAALKGAQAANWLQYGRDARALLSATLARDSLLPARYRHFARGLDAYLAGRADTAIALLERARAADPEWEEAAMALGDAYYHLLPARAPLDSLAEAMFEAAFAADTAFTPPMVHLVEIAVRRGDLRRARRMLRRLEAADADSTLVRMLGLMVDCVARGADAFDPLRTARGNTIAILYAAKSLAAGATHPACAEAGFRAVITIPDAPAGQRWSALLGLQGTLAARGRIAELTTLLDSANASGTFQALWLYVLDAEGGLAVHEKGALMESMARQRFGDAYHGASPPVQWLLATWHARQGQTSQVRALAESLAARVTDSGPRMVRLLADAASAQLAFAERDSTTALRRLRALHPTASAEEMQWSIWEPLAVERLKLARLLLARLDFAEAHRVARSFDHQQPIANLPFIPASLAIRYAAAEGMNRPDLAATYRRRLERLGRLDLIASR